MSPNKSKKAAYKFIILLGFVSLFADVTYEGARSITGPFLAVLGANAAVVGIVSGLGELVGYGLRLVSGYLTDKTTKYWAIMLVGYVVNLVAVPLLALAGRWEIAASLIIAERLGKAIRTPARDAILSHATGQIGRGWGFGLHESMDKTGSLLGPLIVSLVLYLKGGYREGFAILLIPALIALCVILVARFIYPNPSHFETTSTTIDSKILPKVFWVYLAAVAFIAAGYADFPLIAFHFKKLSIVSDMWIPIFYSVAMGTDAIAALVFGRIFDRVGVSIMIVVSLLSALFAPLVFFFGFYPALVGMMLWGIGMGAQQSVMRAVVANMIPKTRRGSAYGIFNMGYGLFWFLGSALMGVLYDVSINSLVIFSILAQLASIPFLIITKRMQHSA